MGISRVQIPDQREKTSFSNICLNLKDLDHYQNKNTEHYSILSNIKKLENRKKLLTVVARGVNY